MLPKLAAGPRAAPSRAGSRSAWSMLSGFCAVVVRGRSFSGYPKKVPRAPWA